MEQNGLLAQNKKDPKQQELFDIAVANGLSILHDEETTAAMIQQINVGDDPIEEIAKVALTVITRLEGNALEKGITVDDSMKADIVDTIVGETIGIAEAAGMQKLSDEQRYQAFSLTVGMYLDNAVKTGKMTKEELIQMGKEAEQTPQGKQVAQGLASAGQAQQIPQNLQNGGQV